MARLGSGPLTEAAIAQHIAPLFSRALAGDRQRAEIYLANHSLGRPPDRTADDVQSAIAMWYSRMDACWDDDGWLAEMDRYRAAIAQLIGFSRGDSIVPKTSAGQGLRAVLNSKVGIPIRVVATRGEFDSVDFILKTYAKRGQADVAWVEPTCADGPAPLFDSAAIVSEIRSGADVVVVSQVFFGTGQVLDGLNAIVAAAHAAGAIVIVDAYHAAGVMPLELEALDVDFVIGGCYKYLRGGPGACWLAIHPRILADSHLRTLDTGWFAKKDTFRYERPEEPLLGDGGDAWLESTPPVLTAYQAKAGLELVNGIGPDRLRAYSLRQQAAMRLAFARFGSPLHEPRDAQAFGAFSLLPSPDAAGFATRLKAAGVNVDARGGFVRFCPDLLTTTDELNAAAEIASRIV